MQRIKLDAIDRRILHELQDDGRITNVELSHRAKISASPCLRRVRALEQAGFIKGYHADLDAKALGYEVMAFAFVGLSSQAEPDLKAFDDYLFHSIAHVVEHELRHLPARPAPSPAAEAIGVCDGPGARQLFFATVEQVIVPGLRAHGLDALTAWRAAQRLNA